MGKTFVEKLNCLPTVQRALWPRLREVPRHFVLYGGTALALRLGHRSSEDFDFFTSEPVDPQLLLNSLTLFRAATPIQQAANTLTVMLAAEGAIKVSFFGGLTLHRVGEPQFDRRETVLVASIDDLAASKLAVIYQRAEAKDYLDIAAILKSGVELPRALGYAEAVYGSRFNPVAALKALAYFEDGNLRSLPEQVKRTLTRAAAETTSIIPAQPQDRFVTPREYRSKSPR